MASADIETKTLVINKLDTAKLKELKDAGDIKNDEVYVTTDPLYHDLSNITPMTADKVVITNVDGKFAQSETTSAELAFVHGVTSNIQEQIDTKANQTDVTNNLALKANIESPELTGKPLAPTADAGTNDKQIASTEFVMTAISNATPGVDNVTIESFDNSAATGGSTHDIRVKDGGLTIDKVAADDIVLKTDEKQSDATFVSFAKVKEMVDNATPVVDTKTISYNDSTQLQSIGVINKNTNDSMYHWVGTLKEYDAAVEAGTIKENWVCCVTDDFIEGRTFAGEIVSVTKTFDTESNHIDFTEKCMTKNYLSVFQDRIFIYPDEYTLDDDFLGITFTKNMSVGSVVTVNYFKGVPSSKIDEVIAVGEKIPTPTVDNTTLTYKNNQVTWQAAPYSKTEVDAKVTAVDDRVTTLNTSVTKLDTKVTDVETKITSSDAPGFIKIWAGSSAPAGYLLCDGSAVSRTTYSALFAAIGTLYGVGDGSSTFNLPNYTNQSTVVKFVTEGNNWYRLYSDGWLEQGSMSVSLNATAAAPFTIQYIVPYASSDYQMITMTPFEQDASDTGSNLTIIGRNPDSFTGVNVGYSRNPLVLSWQAVGKSNITLQQHIWLIKY